MGKKKNSRPPFKIIAGHHGGTISSMRELSDYLTELYRRGEKVN